MALYTKDELRKIFRAPFNRESWKAILHNLFRADMIRTTSEKFTDDDDPEEGYYMGALNTADSFRIGLFYYKISSGSVAHKRVGLRNLVRKFINESWGEFDAAIVVFNDGAEWRLSFVCDIKDVATTPKRFTYVFGEHDNFYRTPLSRFLKLQSQEATFENIREAFSVEALSDDFFDEYRELYADFVQYITGKRFVKDGGKWVERELSNPNYQYEATFDKDDKLVRDYIKKMFGRIVFLYFLQRKGWLNDDRQYMHNLYYNSDQKDNFLDGVLEALFFEVLNTDKPYRTDAAKALPGSENIPYLNGGLFAQDDIDLLDCIFPEDYFKKLFDFLDSYNFTIDENDAEDAEIGIDPEMLGRIFENLLEDNKDKGAFYTPKEIVNYMCKESIVSYLQDDRFTTDGNALIRQFVETLDENLLSKDQRIYIKDKLKSVKICDPAIGSGAFPMGLVNLLSKLYAALKISTEASEIKRHIMEQSIYGVDIEKGAVDIARLRFWLAMIVEEKDPIPLPNLHFKIMQGNSLLESYKGVDLSDLTKVDSQSSLFDSTNAEREDLLLNLREYYETSAHGERDKRFTRIIRNVRRQIYAKNPNISQENFDPSENSDFFLWHTWFSEVFDNGGFDIVIGNPPYIKEYTNRHAFDGFREISPYYKGKMDLWYGFACYGIDYLRHNGIECLIAQNNWTTSEGASILRDKIVTDATIQQLVDFNDYKVFESAGIQTMIMMFRKNKNQNQYSFLLKSLNANAKKSDMLDLLNGTRTDYTNIEYFTFERDKFKQKKFSFSNETELLDKITGDFETLNAKEIIQGIVPALDDYFILGSTSGFTEKERVYIKPYYTGLKERYESYPIEKYLIYISAKNFRGTSLDDYPNLKFHFEPYKEELTDSKIKYKTPNKPYFFVHRERDEKFFKQGNPKIAVQIRCQKPRFFYTVDMFYGSRAMFFIQTSRYDMAALTGLFNSKLIEFWLESTGKKQGQLFKLDKEPLLSIPIPFKGHQQEVSILSDLVLQIQKNRLNNIDTSDLENQVDIIVYKLFNLDYAEIQSIEGETAITRKQYESYKL